MDMLRRLSSRIAMAGFAAGVALASIAPAHAEKRVALVVGNSTYQNASRLPNPVNDANAVAALFKNAGFDVVEARRDLGNLDFKRAIRDFAAVTRDADIAVVFFAGHGIEIDGTNYLLPVDAKLASDFDVEDETLSLDRIMRTLEPAKRLRLIILDACRDNPFVRTMRRSIATRAIARGLAKVEPTSTDTLIAFAAKAGSTAEDGASANSPFTHALLKHIAEPGLDIRLAFGRVRDEVLKNTGNRQEPFVYGSLGGATVALVPPRPQPVASAPPSAAADPNAAVRRDYELAERVGSKEAWDSFLAIHGTGFYADLARAQRAKLDAAESAKSREPNIAALAPAAPTEPAKPPAATGPSAAEVARLLQEELNRVGCNAGKVDGDWGAGSRHALELFNKNAGTKLDVKVASIDALDAVREKSTRVCPLECERGFRAEGDRCVEIPRAAARSVDPPAKSVDPPARARPPRERQGTPAPAQSGQSVACDRFTCKPVPRGCRVERGFERDVTVDRIICP